MTAQFDYGSSSAEYKCETATDDKGTPQSCDFPRLAGSPIFAGLHLKLCKLGRHGRVAARQLLDRHILGLVVRQTEVVIRTNEFGLRLLETLDSLVDLGDGVLELPRRQVIVPGEA